VGRRGGPMTGTFFFGEGGQRSGGPRALRRKGSEFVGFPRRWLSAVGLAAGRFGRRERATGGWHTGAHVCLLSTHPLPEYDPRAPSVSGFPRVLGLRRPGASRTAGQSRRPRAQQKPSGRAATVPVVAPAVQTYAASSATGIGAQARRRPVPRAVILNAGAPPELPRPIGRVQPF